MAPPPAAAERGLLDGDRLGARPAESRAPGVIFFGSGFSGVTVRITGRSNTGSHSQHLDLVVRYLSHQQEKDTCFLGYPTVPKGNRQLPARGSFSEARR